MDRFTYTQRMREFAVRGSALPQSKLNEQTVAKIRRDYARARKLRAKLETEYSAAGFAKKYGIHTRTVEKILSWQTWIHVK